MLILRFLRKQLQHAKKALSNWMITEYRWPWEEDHLSLLAEDHSEEQAADVVPDAEQVDPSAPAHTSLASNLAYTQAHGARAAEGVGWLPRSQLARPA